MSSSAIERGGGAAALSLGPTCNKKYHHNLTIGLLLTVKDMVPYS
jgi:hypothetical protein